MSVESTPRKRRTLECIVASIFVFVIVLSLLTRPSFQEMRIAIKNEMSAQFPGEEIRNDLMPLLKRRCADILHSEAESPETLRKAEQVADAIVKNLKEVTMDLYNEKQLKEKNHYWAAFSELDNARLTAKGMGCFGQVLTTVRYDVAAVTGLIRQRVEAMSTTEFQSFLVDVE